MKKNNQGFMLVEVIVTATVIITAMVALYSNYNRLYTKYKEKDNYYSLNAAYATKLMINSLMKNNFNQFINAIFKTSNYYFIIANKTPSTTVNDYQIPDTNKALTTLYNVNDMVITEYDKSSLESLKSVVENQTFKEYIDYIIDYYGIADNSEYAYIVLTEIEEDNNVEYANIRIR